MLRPSKLCDLVDQFTNGFGALFCAAYEGLVGLEQSAGRYRKLDLTILRQSHDPFGVRNFSLPLRELDDKVGLYQHDHDSPRVRKVLPFIFSSSPDVTNIWSASDSASGCRTP